MPHLQLLMLAVTITLRSQMDETFAWKTLLLLEGKKNRPEELTKSSTITVELGCSKASDGGNANIQSELEMLIQVMTKSCTFAHSLARSLAPVWLRSKRNSHISGKSASKRNLYR